MRLRKCHYALFVNIFGIIYYGPANIIIVYDNINYGVSITKHINIILRNCPNIRSNIFIETYK